MPSFRGLAENFLMSLYKSLNGVLHPGFIDSQLHDNTVIKGITTCLSKGAASDNGGGWTTDEYVFDPPVDPEVLAF